jgi:tRNA(His) 5'-end guanylyltransferase
MSSATLKSPETIELRDHFTKCTSTLFFDGSCNVDLNDLISDFSVLHLTLENKLMSIMDFFEHVRKVDCYPNISVAYWILFTMHMTMDSAERFLMLKPLKNFEGQKCLRKG